MKTKLTNWFTRQDLTTQWKAYVVLALVFIVLLLAAPAGWLVVTGWPTPVAVAVIAFWAIGVYRSGDLMLDLGLLLDMARERAGLPRAATDDEGAV